MVRVLVVAPAPIGDGRIGGIANFIHGFVRYAPDDFEIEIVGTAVADEAAGRGWQDLTLAGRSVRFLPVARMATSRRTGILPLKMRVVGGMILGRRRIATNGRVAQVHSPAMEVGLIGRDVPIVRVVHNSPRDLATTSGESAWSRLGGLIHVAERRTFRRAGGVFFVNRATYEEYATDAEVAQRSHYLPNFYDESRFQRLGEKERQGRREVLGAELGIPPVVPWILFAGRLDQQKNPLLAIEAFACSSSSQPDGSPSVLLVAGEGALREAAEENASRLGVAGRVRFLGNVPQELLARLMPAADALLISSLFEAGPTVAFEALGSGLPLVATPVGEIPNLTTHGLNGWIAQDGSAAALAAGIEWAIVQDRLEIANKCEQAVSGYRAKDVLTPFFDEHRRLAELSRIHGDR